MPVICVKWIKGRTMTRSLSTVQQSMKGEASSSISNFPRSVFEQRSLLSVQDFFYTCSNLFYLAWF